MGHKRTFAAHKPMSGLPPKADIEWRLCDVCFLPKANIIFDQRYLIFLPIADIATNARFRGDRREILRLGGKAGLRRCGKVTTLALKFRRLEGP